jgi:glycosyltransferase involved in cell wall biosynthesis
MRNLRPEAEIMANWKGDISKPVVSVCCTTYNHESYIEDALEGFLIQETDFSFEIIIHDDASTDKTADIIREYAAAYPQIIKTIVQIENQYSINFNLPSENIFNSAKSEYIATCEGDDFWNDKNKLSKQFYFLEENKGCVASGHDSNIVNEKNEVVLSSRLNKKLKMDYKGYDLKKGIMPGYFNCLFFRNCLDFKGPEIGKILNGDVFLACRLGQHGDYHYHEDIKPSSYREHQGGVWSKIGQVEKASQRLNSFYWISQYYTRIGEDKLAEFFSLKAAQVVLSQNKVTTLNSFFKLNLLVFKLMLRTSFPKLFAFFKKKFR